MDYEKEYKEALERAREYHKVDKDNTLKLYAKGTMEYLFPVLAESEDEKIRKALIKYFTLSDDNADYQCYDVHYKDIVAWLEKQSQTFTQEDVDNAYLKGICDAKEAGYEWNAEKKKLNKISQRMVSAEAKEAIYDKPAWSEEDEYQINTILHWLDLKRELCKKVGNKVEEYRYDKQYNWLKSIKDRL